MMLVAATLSIGFAALSFFLIRHFVAWVVQTRPNTELSTLRTSSVTTCLVATLLVCSILAVTGIRLIFVLLCLASVPIVLTLRLQLLHKKYLRELETSGIALLYGLQGLCRAGLGLPYALFRLTEKLPGLFSSRLHRALLHFEKGDSLGDCLLSFLRKEPLGRMGATLQLLSLIYQRGLPVSDALAQEIGMLEADANLEKRRAALRASARGQAILAIFVPWILLGWTTIWEPETLAKFWEGNFGYPCIVTAMASQLCGWLVVEKTARFYR